MTSERSCSSIARIAREPDGNGYFAHIVELPAGAIVELADGFAVVDDAIAWAMSRAQGSIIRLGFSSEYEYALGEVPNWSGKSWPPAVSELPEIERHVAAVLAADDSHLLTLEVEPETRMDEEAFRED